MSQCDATTGATINASFITGLSGPYSLVLSDSNLYVANSGNGTIGKYNATTGAPINASMISGLEAPAGLAVSGSSLYVANFGTHTVGEYNASTGAAINASFINGLNFRPLGLAVSGSNLYVVNILNGAVGEYDAATGATINASFISGSNSSSALVASGSTLYGTNDLNGSVGEFDSTTGAPINPSFISGLNSPTGIAISGNNLYLLDSGTVGEYDATTGAAINPSLISGSGSSYPIAIAVSPAPPVISSTLSATGTNGLGLNYQIVASNNPASFGAGGLPTGLGFDSSTGLISGTPSASGTFAVTISAVNTGGTASETLSLIVITPSSPLISSVLSATGTTYFPFDYQITATNYPTSFSVSGLPLGLSFSASTGLISGTPSATGTFTPTISGINAGGTASATLSIDVLLPPAPVISSTLSATGTADFALDYQIAATNFPTKFGATGLPQGMGVNPSTGLISGTPLATGTFTPTISAINLGGTGSATLSVSLSAPPVPVIAGTLSATGTSGVAFDYQIAASNNPTSYGASSLPQGLSVSSSTGLISGMPATIGTFSAIISATNAGGFDSEALTLNILPLPPAIISGLAASGVMGSAFDYQIVATNNPASFTATGLPPGLSVNASTGLISGTPTASGMFATTIGVTNANTAAKDNLWLMVTENLNRSAGSYEGLGAIGGTNVGLFTMSLTAKGGFTGKLRVAGATYPLKGTFSSYGTFSSIRSVGANTLDIALSVNPAVPEVSGIITTITASENNSYSVEGSLLRKYNANTLPKGLSGNYSSVIPGVSGTDLVLPHEPGHGTMSVASTGAVHIVGKLGDGTAFGARGQLHADGKTFTLFDALYAGKNPGTIAGNIILESSTNSDWDADLDWIKPAQPGATNYPGGFSVSVDLLATKNASPAPLAKTAPLSPSPQLSPPLPRP